MPCPDTCDVAFFDVMCGTHMVPALLMTSAARHLNARHTQKAPFNLVAP